MVKKRPISICAISALYLLLALGNILGAINQITEKNPVVLSILIWGLAIIITILIVMASIYLFLLKKITVKLFGAAFSLTIIACVCQYLRLVPYLPGCFTALNMAVCLMGAFAYAIQMCKKQILS